jgi:hypothetical protein
MNRPNPERNPGRFIICKVNEPTTDVAGIQEGVFGFIDKPGGLETATGSQIVKSSQPILLQQFKYGFAPAATK